MQGAVPPRHSLRPVTDAVEPERRRWVCASAVVLGCVVGQSFARFTFGLLLPAVKADLHISYGLAGWLGTINLFGYLAGTIATSIASLRFAPHRILQVGIATATLGMVLLATAPGTPVLLVGMLIAGAGGAAAWVPAPIVASAAFPPRQRGLAMGLCSAGIGIGIVIATLLTDRIRALTHDPGAWRSIWVAEAVVAVGVTMFSLRVIRPLPVTPGSPPKLNVLRSVPRWWAPTAAYACFGLGYVLFTVFVVAALQHDAGFAVGASSRVFAIMGLGIATGALTVGRLSDRLGRRSTMVSSFVLAALACCAVLIGSEPLVSISSWLFGIGMSGSVVSIAAHLGDHVRPQDFSAAFGVVTVAFGCAQTIGPRLGGWMADRAGNFHGVFVLAAVAWALGAVLAVWTSDARVAAGTPNRGSKANRLATSDVKNAG